MSRKVVRRGAAPCPRASALVEALERHELLSTYYVSTQGADANAGTSRIHHRRQDGRRLGRQVVRDPRRRPRRDCVGTLRTVGTGGWGLYVDQSICHFLPPQNR